MCSSDLQIEARVLVWLAGQDDVVQWYREDRDVYCEFATTVYDRPITKANKTERAVGKTCILGLGYGTGWAKLQQTLKLAAGVDLDEQECKRLVGVYRQVNSKVIDLWKACDDALQYMASWNEISKPYYLDKHNVIRVEKEGLRLPNGLYIRYPGLTWDTSESKSKFIYKSRRGFNSIWGGSVVENIVQALARIIIGEQMLIVNRKYRPVLTVHDAIVNVVPANEIDDAMKYITDIMSTPPDWAKDLPVACEAHFGDSYGDC